MLTCIACPKQLNTRSPSDPDEDDTAATPRTKQAIKALTSQIKDMVVKASGAYKHCNPCSGGSNHNKNRSYADTEVGSESERFRCSYRRTGDSNSTPRLNVNVLSSGEGTPVSVSGRTESVVFTEDENESKEWVAQVEPGVLITFFSMPEGGNDLKRIQFSREMFNKRQAQQWWAENYDKVLELYNVQKFNQQAIPLQTPPRSKDEKLEIGTTESSPATPPLTKERIPSHFHRPTAGRLSSGSLERQPSQSRNHYDLGGLTSSPKHSSISASKSVTSSIDASARTSSSREADRSGELSVSNASDTETEWVEEDEPGVYITIRALPGGTRELRRVRFSREKFGEMHARLWWEENRARIQEEYL